MVRYSHPLLSFCVTGRLHLRGKSCSACWDYPTIAHLSCSAEESSPSAARTTASLWEFCMQTRKMPWEKTTPQGKHNKCGFCNCIRRVYVCSCWQRNVSINAFFAHWSDPLVLLYLFCSEVCLLVSVLGCLLISHCLHSTPENVISPICSLINP